MTYKARGLYASSSKEPRRFRVGPWLVLGAVLVAALVVATAVSVLDNVGVDRGDSSDSFAAAGTVEVGNRTGGGVTLTGGDTEEVRVERTMRGSPLTEPEEEVRQGEDTLRMKASCAGVALFGLLGNCSIDYEITVPTGTAVTVETLSGRISVENVDGRVDLASTSGQVSVSGNSGDVTAESTSGGIDLAGIRGSVDAESTSGRITAEGEGESLQAESTSGGVDVSAFSARTVVAESTSGSVLVGGGFTSAEVSAVSGGIEVTTDEPFDLLTVESTSGSVEVRVPRGAYRVTGESVSGDRDLRVDTSQEADSRIDADTVSGSLTVAYL